LEPDSNRLSLLLEANLRFLSASLQQNSIIINTLNNPNALDEHQNVLNSLLIWLKSLNQLNDLSQGEQTLIDSLKESVRKAKSIDIPISKMNTFSLINNTIETNRSNLGESTELKASESVVIETEVSTDQTSQEVEHLGETDVPTAVEPITEEKIEKTFFYRMSNEEDRWDYLVNITTFIASYEHLMHLLIPNLILEVVKELHRYDCDNKLVINEAITYPSTLLQNLVTKVLREAPGSNLFRRIRRIKLDHDIDLNYEQTVNIGERHNIKGFVSNYFSTLSEYLDPEIESVPELGPLEEKTKHNFKQFSLGPISVEMRLTAIIKHTAESAWKDAEQALTNENASLKTKAIYLGTTQLICDFQNFLLNESRLLTFLEELKS